MEPVESGRRDSCGMRSGFLCPERHRDWLHLVREWKMTFWGCAQWLYLGKGRGDGESWGLACHSRLCTDFPRTEWGVRGRQWLSLIKPGCPCAQEQDYFGAWRQQSAGKGERRGCLSPLFPCRPQGSDRNDMHKNHWTESNINIPYSPVIGFSFSLSLFGGEGQDDFGHFNAQEGGFATLLFILLIFFSYFQNWGEWLLYLLCCSF